MKKIQTPLLAAGAMLLVIGSAGAALPWLVTGVGTGGSLPAALSEANADARTRCMALGRSAPAHLDIVETQRIGLQYHVTVTGHCGEIMAAR